MIRNARKGRTEWVWSSKKGELEPKTLKNQLGTYVVAFLWGLGVTSFGYMIYTGLIWDLLYFIFSPQHIWIVFIACLAFIFLVFLLTRTRKSSN